MNRLSADNGVTYEVAKLLDGSILHDVRLVRAQGYDTRLFVTDGEVFAPMDAVLYFGKEWR